MQVRSHLWKRSHATDSWSRNGEFGEIGERLETVDETVETVYETHGSLAKSELLAILGPES